MGDQAHMQPNPNFAWVISEEQRIQFQKDFKLVDTDQDDFLSGDQARDLFMGSGVPVDDLVHIWRLSDRDGDNQLSEMEFAIARFLIYARLNGQNVNMEKVPDSLIQSILENDPRPEPVKKSGSHSDKKMARQNSSKLPKVHPPPSEKDKEKEEKEREKELAKERAKAAKEAARDKKKTAQVSAKQWTISSGQRKKYKAVFKQHSKNGFINGQQALVLFGASKLPNEMLAQIWALSDMDHDNQLSQQEFFVGLHLISKVREGYDLPETTPAALVASASKRSKSSAKPSKKSSGNLKNSGNQMTPVNPDVASDPSTVHQTPVTEVPHSVSRTDTSPLATINATINTAQPVTGSRMTPVIPEFSIEQELALWDQNSDTVKRARDYQLSLENEVSQISLAIGRLKVLEEGMADRYNYRVEQYKLLEYQKNKFQLILNNIMEQCKGEEEELTELTSELKTLWHEMEEQQKIVADPSYEPQQIKAKRKQISEEFDHVKQLYVQSKDEYDALVKEIEFLRAEVAQSSSTEQLQHFNDQFVSMQVTDTDRAKFQGDFDAKQEFDFSDLDQQPGAQSGQLDFEHFSFKPSQEHNNMVTFNNNLDMLSPPTLTDMHSEFTEDTESVSQYEDGFDDWMTQTAIAMSLNQPASKDQLQRLDSLKALEQGGAPPEANPFGVTPIKERGRRKSSVGSTTSSASASKKAQKEAEKQKAKAEKEAKKRDKVLQRQNSKKENKKNKGH